MKSVPLLLITNLLAALLPVAINAQQAGVKTVSFQSDSVGRTMKYNLVLPVNYEKGDQRYPVLYLLHGLTSNYTDWARMKVPEYASRMEVIVVMPDAGNSWYVNWAKSENGQKNNWEDSIIKDLIPHVDATYRTIARREGRAINGLSMGGYGGLMLGLKNHELFCSIGSHSGAIGFAKSYAERLKQGNVPGKSNRTPSEVPNPKIDIPGFSSQKERTPQGVCFASPEDCEKYDPFKLVLQIPRDKLPHIYFDCGLEDRLIASNLEFVKLLTENKIPFTFGQSPGGHKPDYWAREVGNSMAMQLAVMQRNLTAEKNVETGK